MTTTQSSMLFRAVSTILIFLTAIFALTSALIAGPTFSKDVAPILYKRCVSCHRPGDIAPMSLLDYKSARPWAKAIREAVLTRKMPPWFADPRYGQFSNDPRLSAHEIEMINAWSDAGAPQGDPNDLPPRPTFVDGWQLGNPDVVIDIGQDFVVPAGNDHYENFTVPTNFTDGKWIWAAQVLPGNRQAVHHVHVVLVAEGDAAATVTERSRAIWELKDGLPHVRDDAPVVNDACGGDSVGLPNLSGFEEGSFAAMLPGRAPDIFGDNMAKWIPARAKLRFEVHYAKVGRPQTDRTKLGLYLAAKAPAMPIQQLDLRNRYFRIPSGAQNHEVKRCYDFEKEKLLVSITPHMHYRGKDALYELVRPNGQREILLSLPRYSFNWQLAYRFRNPVYAERGSRLVVTFHYDNGPNNPSNPDSTQVVRWGARSEDEMMASWIQYVNVPASTVNR